VPLLIHALAVDEGGWLVTPSCPAWGGSRFPMDGWCRCSCGLPRACCTSADEFPGVLAPPSSGGTPMVLALDVANAAAVFTQAVRAGAAIRQPRLAETLKRRPRGGLRLRTWMAVRRGG
jgi:hypothetical protein